MRKLLVVLSLLPIIAFALAGCDEYFGGAPKDEFTMSTLLGTWTDLRGEPGNYLTFYEQRVELGGAGAAIEGLVTAEKIAGVREKTTARWNWENWDPVRMNLVLPKIHIALVKAVDHNHLRVKFATNVSEVMNVNIATDPTAVMLTRTREKLPVPTVDKPFGAPARNP